MTCIKKNKIIIIIISIIVLVVFLFALVFHNIPKRLNEKTIINKFKENKTLFDESMIELNSFAYKGILIRKEFLMYEVLEDNYPKMKDRYTFSFLLNKKYPKTLKVLNNNSLYMIDVDRKNIKFCFYGFLDYNNGIAYIEDIGDFKGRHSPTTLKKIDGNWYYYESR